MSKNKIMERIKKMMALADPASNEFEEEVRVATEMIKKLMAAHNITMSEVGDYIDPAGGSFEEKVAYTGELSIWKEGLVVVVETLTGTQALVQGHKDDMGIKRIVFIGRPDSVAIAKSLYTTLLETLYRRAQESFPPAFYADRINRSYLRGFVHRLFDRAKENVQMETPVAQEKYELMVVNEAAALKEFVNKKHTPGPAPKRKSDVNQEAYDIGFLDASNENLDARKTLR